MAHLVVIGNQTFKRRSPVGVWLGLPLITLGIYHLVWWFKVNSECRRFTGDRSIKPGVSLLAITLGGFLLIPPFVSIYTTTERVRRVQQQAGVPAEELANPWIGLILAFIVGLHSLYIQVNLNKVWDRQQAMTGAAVAV